MVLKFEEFKDLSLIVAGNCNPLPGPTEVIEFVAEMRHSESKEIEISNDTDQNWNLKPFILGDYFETVSNLTIAPREKKMCSITYTPHKKTNEPDVASITLILFEIHANFVE